MWTVDDIQALLSMSRRLTASEASEAVEKDQSEVAMMALAFGCDIPDYNRTLHWCPTCATWRTSPDCRVCELKRQLHEARKASTKAYQEIKDDKSNPIDMDTRPMGKMTTLPTEKLHGSLLFAAMESNARIIEEKEVEHLIAEKNRIKQATYRYRKKGGE